jgi:hypothetical protein
VPYLPMEYGDVAVFVEEALEIGEPDAGTAFGAPCGGPGVEHGDVLAFEVGTQNQVFVAAGFSPTDVEVTVHRLKHVLIPGGSDDQGGQLEGGEEVVEPERVLICREVAELDTGFADR